MRGGKVNVLLIGEMKSRGLRGGRAGAWKKYGLRAEGAKQLSRGVGKFVRKEPGEKRPALTAKPQREGKKEPAQSARVRRGGTCAKH